MSWRGLSVLIALALLAVLADLAVRGPVGWTAPGQPVGRVLLPQLAAARARVTAITVQPPATAPVVLRRAADGWRVESTQSPADPQMVEDWLDRFARARILETKTRLPAQYPQLGVAGPGRAGAGIMLTLEGVPGLPQLLVGHYDARQDGTFIRLRGQAQSLLVGGDLTPPVRAVDWMRHPLLSLPASAVLQVDVLGRDGARFLIDRSLDGTPRVRIAAPQLRQPLALGVLLLGLFDGFDYAGVLPRSAAPPQAVQLRALLSDGSLLTLLAWRDVRGRPLGNLDIQAPAGGLPADAAAGLARTAARVQAHTWQLAPGTWSLLQDALYPAAAPARATTVAAPPDMPSATAARPALRGAR